MIDLEDDTMGPRAKTEAARELGSVAIGVGLSRAFSVHDWHGWAALALGVVLMQVGEWFRRQESK